jgi:hypothetical protein
LSFGNHLEYIYLSNITNSMLSYILSLLGNNG